VVDAYNISFLCATYNAANDVSYNVGEHDVSYNVGEHDVGG
jgi:hypothetical protein